ncbi:carbohydrate ABC transporter permease, partial [bacterium]|nr:carbohydrate ABC transporter permease [bacterium]
MSRGKRSLPATIFFYLGLAAMLAFLLFPFYWTFVTSVKPESELYGETVTYWPKTFSIESYRKLFTEFNFLKPMANSLAVATMTTVISLTVSVLAAYAFSRYRFKGRKLLMTMFLTN